MEELEELLDGLNFFLEELADVLDENDRFGIAMYGWLLFYSSQRLRALTISPRNLFDIRDFQDPTTVRDFTTNYDVWND